LEISYSPEGRIDAREQRQFLIGEMNMQCYRVMSDDYRYH